MTDAALAIRVLQQAYDLARLLEEVAQSPAHVRIAKALSMASWGTCQALLTVSVDDHEHKVVHAVVAHLERAGDALAGQASASASLARQEVGRAVGLLKMMDEIDWSEREMADAA